jgi:class 3 adenylate cyclase
MRCPECQQDNREGAKFCDTCGTKLQARCPVCHTQLRPQARFCDECGHALAPETSDLDTGARAPAVEVAERLARPPFGYTPRHLAEKILTSRAALEGERKVVTVLFADCAGFTALSSRLDPEALHDLMDGCFQRVLHAVHRYEGTVNQFTGDGVMALFGAPIAHEDHAVRAVAAALAIQHALGEYGPTVRAQCGIDFALRIGLNSGAVVVGRIGDDLRMDYTAQGETVNLAARLQSAAPPGGILIGEATHRLVERYIVTEDAGLLDLKGFARPVRAFAVAGERARRARFETALERGLTALTGRSTELAVLRACFEKARENRGHVVSLVGEAGIGKSRLAYELRGELDGVAVTCLEAHCFPHSQSLPFHPVLQLLEAQFDLDAGEPEAAKIAKVEAGVKTGSSARLTILRVKHLMSLLRSSWRQTGWIQRNGSGVSSKRSRR